MTDIKSLLIAAAKKGTYKQYLRWVSYQSSILDGTFSEYHDGVGRCIPCHIRRVSYGAGTGIKPPYKAVPMTFDQHALQSHDNMKNGGELLCLKKILPYHQWYEWFDDQPEDQWDARAAEWFEAKGMETLRRWIES